MEVLTPHIPKERSIASVPLKLPSPFEGNSHIKCLAEVTKAWMTEARHTFSVLSAKAKQRILWKILDQIYQLLQRRRKAATWRPELDQGCSAISSLKIAPSPRNYGDNMGNCNPLPTWGWMIILFGQDPVMAPLLLLSIKT